MKEITNYHVHEYIYNEYGVTLKLVKFKEDRNDVHAYVKVDADPHAHPGLESSHIVFSRQNLSSGQAKRQFAKLLEARLPTPEWESIIEEVFTLSIQKYWQGSPIIKIGKQPRKQEVPYLLYPMIRKNAPCIIYGAGGIGKSYVSLYFAMLIQHDIHVGSFMPQKTNVLYLDYESGEEDLNDRLAALSKGMDMEIELDYRYCHQPFSDDVDTISAMVSEGDIGLVIVDAKGAAVGGWINEARQTMDLFNSLRSLNVTSIIIDHVSKENSDAPIGSIYNFNEARNIWEMRGSQNVDSSNMRIGLYHKKTNSGKIHKPFGLEFTFENDDMGNVEIVRVAETDVAEDPVTRKGMALPEQIRIALKNNIDMTGKHLPMSAEQISERIGAKLTSVRSRLSDYVGKDWDRHGKEGYVYKEPDTSTPADLEEDVTW